MNILDLFSGIGGFSRGLMQAGLPITHHYYSEIDKHAIANYSYNFKNSTYVGSVTDVHGRNVPPIDIITFGSPCQDFSLAGKRKGLDGARSSLVHHAIRLIGECRPPVFLWENVKGAFSSNAGADFWAIIQAFANIGGYRLEWQLLNTDWFLPQNRERIYLVGHLAGRSEPGVFPFTDSYCPTDKANLQQPDHHTAGTINCYNNSSRNCFDGGTTLVQVRSAVKRGYEEAGIGDSINFSHPTSNTRKGRVGKKVAQTLDTSCLQGVITGRIAGWHENENVIAAHQGDAKRSTCSEHVYHKPSGTMTNISTSHVPKVITDDVQIRRITEIECERLQGYPDDWTRYGLYDGQVKEISSRPRYKLIGNSVTTDVVEAIGRRLKLT